MTTIVSDGGRTLLILNAEDGTGRLERELAGLGWHTGRADLAAGDLPGLVERLADLLAAPGSPDRAAILGYGEAGLAALEIADRHPERVTAVVVVGTTDHDLAGELSCPTLTLPASGRESVASVVVPFLAALDEQAEVPPHLPAALRPLTPALLNDAELLGRFREIGPVHRLNAEGAATTWILTGHAASTRTLTDPRLAGEVEITAGFRLQSDDPALAHKGDLDLITIDGREHARLRRLIERHLTPERVEALRPRIQRAADALLDAIPAGEVVEFLHAFAYPLPVLVLCELLGVPEDRRGQIREWILERLVTPPPKAHPDIDELLRDLIAARRESPSDDLLGWVVAAEGDGLAEDDLVSAARFLLVNGHRAPTTVLASGLAALLKRPEQWARLVAEPALVAPAVEELLRLVTPFPVTIARQVTAPIEVGGTPIPKGDLLGASLVAANSDPSFFPDPDLLDVGRRDNAHLAFGHGHHHCLGADLARAQLRIAFGTLARRFPGVELARDSRSLHYRQSSVRYLLGLPVVLRPDPQGESAAGA
ncbi:cytochrome P450 [Microbispora sp. H10836]|uniref:cytochrome P450 n=1 Tax=Microbispora sp. H10836 TaxID=2729106 RepID=UPI001472E660|nr:cytochrome P450 [Microbispora sp. H10836]